MAGQPRDARHGGVSWGGTWRSDGRVSAVRIASLAAAIETAAQLPSRQP